MKQENASEGAEHANARARREAKKYKVGMNESHFISCENRLLLLAQTLQRRLLRTRQLRLSSANGHNTEHSSHSVRETKQHEIEALSDVKCNNQHNKANKSQCSQRAAHSAGSQRVGSILSALQLAERLLQLRDVLLQRLDLRVQTLRATEEHEKTQQKHQLSDKLETAQPNRATIGN